jgi:hypothetical protein
MPIAVWMIHLGKLPLTTENDWEGICSAMGNLDGLKRINSPRPKLEKPMKKNSGTISIAGQRIFYG